MTPDGDRLRVESTRLLPVRGMVAMHNRRGRAFGAGDVQRWLRLTRIRHHASKVDLLDYQADVARLARAVAHANTLDMACSLRTLVSQPVPADLAVLAETGGRGVLLDVDDARSPHLELWLDQCREFGWPVRLQFPLARLAEVREIAGDCMRHSAVNVVHLHFHDPLSPVRGESADWSPTFDAVEELIALGRTHDVEVNVVGVPFCLAGEHRAHWQNLRQLALDHQHYRMGSLVWAQKYFERSPGALHAGLLIMQKQGTMLSTPYEERLLRWILDRPWRIWMLQLIRKPLQMVRRRLRRDTSQTPSAENCEQLAEERHRRAASQYVEPCRSCSLRRICDGPTTPFRAHFPDAQLSAIPGDVVTDPVAYAHGQPKYYDAIDASRLPDPEYDRTLAQEALQRIANGPPDRVVPSDEYELYHGFSDRTGAGLRWFALTDAEYGTTALPRVTLPVTIVAEFSAGLADYVGFAINGLGRVACYADGFKHELILHVDRQGRFVLLNNGHLVAPIAFDQGLYLPERIPDVFEPALVAAGIEVSLTTKEIRMWHGARDAAAAQPMFSILIVCNRYARRLQATLAGIGHQRGLPPGAVEVIVAYTPHVDATDDVLDSIQRAFPDLKIVRVPFDESRESKKGYQINEAARLASGEWIVLLDADVILPVDFLATLGATEPDVCFVAPDGRKMLDPDTTAAILLGEVRPWHQWDELMAGPGEWRRRESEGLPVGFCQCVRAKCLRDVPYAEVHGYEYADMKFAQDIVAKYGPEKWLEGMPVLHLDHGGSQWYGTHKHR